MLCVPLTLPSSVPPPPPPHIPPSPPPPLSIQSEHHSLIDSMHHVGDLLNSKGEWSPARLTQKVSHSVVLIVLTFPGGGPHCMPPHSQLTWGAWKRFLNHKIDGLAQCCGAHRLPRLPLPPAPVQCSAVQCRSMPVQELRPTAKAVTSAFPSNQALTARLRSL